MLRALCGEFFCQGVRTAQSRDPLQALLLSCRALHSTFFLSVTLPFCLPGWFMVCEMPWLLKLLQKTKQRHPNWELLLFLRVCVYRIPYRQITWSSSGMMLPWCPQPYHIITGQAGVRCSKESRWTAESSTVFDFLRESFVLLHGEKTTLPFWQAHGEGSFKKSCWEKPDMVLFI